MAHGSRFPPHAGWGLSGQGQPWPEQDSLPSVWIQTLTWVFPTFIVIIYF